MSHIRIEAGVAYPEGALVLDTASACLAEGSAALAVGTTVFDLAGVTQVDSSALSLLLSWQRAAETGARAVSFRNPPDSLHSLARLYGLTELLG